MLMVVLADVAVDDGIAFEVATVELMVVVDILLEVEVLLVEVEVLVLVVDGTVLVIVD